MNKTLIAIATVAVISVGGIIAFLALNSGTLNNTSSQEVKDKKVEEKAVGDACEVLTKPVAEEVLGTKLIEQTNTPMFTQDQFVTLSVCSYISENQKDVSGAQLLVRSAKNEAGKEANKKQFDSTRPGKAVTVKNIGEEAYYSEGVRQLNVLNGGNWYIMTVYSTSNENAGSLANTKLLASKLDFK